MKNRVMAYWSTHLALGSLHLGIRF